MTHSLMSVYFYLNFLKITLNGRDSLKSFNFKTKKIYRLKFKISPMRRVDPNFLVI